MANSLNLSLDDELWSYVKANSGDGSLYVTPSEFVRDLMRQHRSRQEVAAVLDAIVEGYQDAIAGRTVPFKGSLIALLRETASSD